MSKLSKREVKEIKKLYSTGKYTQRKLGRMYNVSSVNINAIVNNKIWKDVV